MIIPPNAEGWSYDDSTGNWKLVYTDETIVIYEQTDQSIATQSVLFFGTEQECKDQIELCGLIKPIRVEPILPEELAGNEQADLVINPADFL